MRTDGTHPLAATSLMTMTAYAVYAAGLWGNDIASMVGITLPIIPMAHLYLITKPVKNQPPTMPTMRDPDNLVYFRGSYRELEN